MWPCCLLWAGPGPLLPLGWPLHRGVGSQHLLPPPVYPKQAGGASLCHPLVWMVLQCSCAGILLLKGFFFFSPLLDRCEM